MSQIEIIHKRGYTIDQEVEIIIDSANGFLLLGKSGAGRIREISDKLNLFQHIKYRLIMMLLPKYIKKRFLRVYKKYNWKPSKAQLYNLCLLLKNKGKPFQRGDAILDKYKINNKKIIHVIGMSYDISHKTIKIPSDSETIKKGISKALDIATQLNIESIGIPVMCARKGYGLTPKKSLNIIEDIIKGQIHSSIKKAIICFDNEETIAYLDKISDKNSLQKKI